MSNEKNKIKQKNISWVLLREPERAQTVSLSPYVIIRRGKSGLWCKKGLNTQKKNKSRNVYSLFNLMHNKQQQRHVVQCVFGAWRFCRFFVLCISPPPPQLDDVALFVVSAPVYICVCVFDYIWLCSPHIVFAKWKTKFFINFLFLLFNNNGALDRNTKECLKAKKKKLIFALMWCVGG